MSRLRGLLAPLVALLIALAVAGGWLALLGADPLAALGALASGAFGDAVALESATLPGPGGTATPRSSTCVHK